MTLRKRTKDLNEKTYYSLYEYTPNDSFTQCQVYLSSRHESGVKYDKIHTCISIDD